jgi:hypothetical protein
MGFEKLDTIPGIKEKVVHHSFIDIFGLMKSLPAWFKEFKYDFIEKGLAEKDIGTGHQVESEWKAERKVDDYLKFNIVLSIKILDLRKIVAEDGSETYWGRTTITINSNVDKDYQGLYKNKKRNKLLKFFVELYDRYFLKDYFIKYTGKSDDEALNLLEHVRKYLK